MYQEFRRWPSILWAHFCQPILCSLVYGTFFYCIDLKTFSTSCCDDFQNTCLVILLLVLMLLSELVPPAEVVEVLLSKVTGKIVGASKKQQVASVSSLSGISLPATSMSSLQISRTSYVPLFLEQKHESIQLTTGMLQ
jgi:hypothetical protein